MKIKTLSTRIIIFVAVIAFVGSFTEAVMTRTIVRNTMKDGAVQSMQSELRSVSDLLASYAREQYAYIEAYAASGDMYNLIQTSENAPASVLAAAQRYTEAFATIVPDFDSMCFTNYDGTCIVHNDPALIGFRNPQETIDMINSAFFPVGGQPMTALSAIVSPASNSVSICVMKTTYKADGVTPAGYCTLALKNDAFNAILDKVQISENQVVILSAASAADPSMNESGGTIYNNDHSQISLPVTDAKVLEIDAPFYEYSTNLQTYQIAEAIGYELLGLDAMPEMPVEPDLEGVINFKDENTGEAMLGYYRFLPDFQWVVYVAVDEATLFQGASSSSGMIFLIALITSIVMIACIWLIIRRLTKPITGVQQALVKVSEFDLTESPLLEELKKRTDEVGSIADATLGLTSMLRDTVGVLRNCSNSLNTGADELESTSQQLVQVTMDNTSTADSLSSGVESTNTSIASVNDEINKIQDLVRNVSDKVEAGEDDSKTLIDNTTSINAKVENDIKANNATLDETVESMKKALESLAAVEKINELVSAIMDITSQTNLLSLNASIEAARAGEAGKGFAVVAGEIGKLAEQSRETAESIQTIVADSNEAVDKVRNNVGKLLDYLKVDVVNNFEEFAKQSKEYGEGVGTIRASVEAIGAAMETLNSSISEIAREIGSVASTSGENASGVRDIVSKNEQMTSVTDAIGRLADDSKKNASDIETVIRQFTL